MQVKSIALWVLAFLLVALLFHFFRLEMARGGAKQGALTVVSPALPVVS